MLGRTADRFIVDMATKVVKIVEDDRSLIVDIGNISVSRTVSEDDIY